MHCRLVSCIKDKLDTGDFLDGREAWYCDTNFKTKATPSNKTSFISRLAVLMKFENIQLMIFKATVPNLAAEFTYSMLINWYETPIIINLVCRG